uniref:Uncharacterized protein n=1 Tax=Clytia hemisphaerica TaxID=252671 RepID=A0A7M6DNL0_9CNID
MDECAVLKGRYRRRMAISKTSVEFLPFKSNLLTLPQIRIIKTWLKETNTFGSYKTCWDTSMKDLSRTNFFDECGNNSPRFDPRIKTWCTQSLFSNYLKTTEF